MMLIIAATTIDQFNKYLKSEEFTQERLIQQITGKCAKSKYAYLGIAFHDLIQNGASRELVGTEPDKSFLMSKDGIAFPWKVISECYEKIDHDFPFEIPKSKIYHLNNGIEVKVTCRIDQGKGREVNEYKSNWTWYKYEDYYQSSQWKSYLEIYDADRVNYLVFLMRDRATGIICEGLEEFSFERYENLERDNLNLLTDFVDFIQSQNLEEYFEEKT